MTVHKSWAVSFLLAAGAAAASAPPFSFQAPASYTAQQIPMAMVQGDFNGDGKPDLAVGNAGSYSVSVLLGKGDGTFQPAVTYAAPSGCAVNYLAAADFNHDGHADLLAFCLAGKKVVFFPGRGDGSFGPVSITPLPLSSLAGDIVGVATPPAIADFDADGNLDIVMSLSDVGHNIDASPMAYLLRGLGDGTFQTPQLIPAFAGIDALRLAAAGTSGGE